MNDPADNQPQNPVIEAIVDIECDMPPGFQLASLEAAAQQRFGDRYPVRRTQHRQEHRFETLPGTPMQHSVLHGIQSFQFLTADEKEIVQVRTAGFSFNRLAPYESLDACLPEIERTWRLFTGLAGPQQVRLIRLRHINRIPLPLIGGRVQLDDFFRVCPHLPDEDNLTFTGFLNQHTAVEAGTGHVVNIVLSTQPQDQGVLPIIFDNCVEAAGAVEPENWPWIFGKIRAMRELSYRIFTRTLTPSCLNLFQQP